MLEKLLNQQQSPTARIYSAAALCKDMHVGITGDFKLAAGVKDFMSLYVSLH